MESFAPVDQWLSNVQTERRHLLANYRKEVEAFLGSEQARAVESLGHRNLDAWKALEQMPFERLKALAENFAVYREICAQEISKDRDVTNTQLVWRFMGRLGLVPPANLMSLLKETDVIEIYDLNFNQIYRNLNFFKVSSYSFEDLMHIPLEELFARAVHIKSLLFREIDKVFSGDARDAFLSKLPRHLAEERFSRKRYSAQIHQRVMSPLFNSTGHVLGILASIDVTILDSKQPSPSKLHSSAREVFA